MMLLVGCADEGPTHSLTSYSSSTPTAPYLAPTLANVIDREQMGDQKARAADSSSKWEYQTARGLALARIEKIEITIRDAIFLSRHPPPPRAARDMSGLMSWHQALLEFQASLSNSERSIVADRIAQMSRDDQEWVMVQGANVDFFTQEMNVHEMREMVDEWRGLRLAVERMKRKCMECS